MSIVEEKCCLLFSNTSFCFRDIQVFKIYKLANVWFFVKILLNVLHNTSLTVWLPWQHTRFQTSNTIGFFGNLWHSILIFTYDAPYAWSSKHILKCVTCRLGLWPRLKFFKLKIINVLKSSGWGLEKSELPWEPNFI